MFFEQLLDTLEKVILPPKPPEGYKYCRACGGTGHAQGTSFAYYFPCAECNGTGVILIKKSEIE